MKRRLCSLLFIVISLCSIAGCRSEPSVPAKPDATTTPVPTTAPTNPPTPTPAPDSLSPKPVLQKADLPDENIIYLTFDDGPGYYTPDILDLLEKYKVKATFFVSDTGRPDYIADIYNAGHSIGIHCQNHDYDAIYASEEAYFADLYRMEAIIYQYTGIHTTLLRFPGGSSNKVSSYNPGIMTRLTKLVEERGFQYFDWNVSSADTETEDTRTIIEEIKNGIRSQSQYSIVLQHAECKEYSFHAIEEILLWGLENGYTFLPLDATSPTAHHCINN